jgi:hypothetical protein
MAQPIAFVLLDRHVVPDMNAVAAAIRARHPDVPVEVAAAGEAGQAAGSPLISCAGQMVVVMSIPAALPRDEGVLDTASRTWPQAKATFARHRAHLIVSTLGASENRLPVVRAMTFLQSAGSADDAAAWPAFPPRAKPHQPLNSCAQHAV